MLSRQQRHVVLQSLFAHEYRSGLLPSGLSQDERIAWALENLEFSERQREILYPKRMTFEAVSDPPAPRTSKHLIISVAVGTEHEELIKLSGKYMQAYARRIGADFHVLTGKTQSWWGLEKFRIKPFVEQYQRTLFLDADILIRDGAPDIFELVPEAHIGMHNDRPYQKVMEWAIGERTRLWDSQELPQWHPPYLRNTGVVVCDNFQSDIWTPPIRPMPGEHCNEQFWIERIARHYLSFDLPLELNTQWYMEGFTELAKRAWFIHLANCPSTSRKALMEEFLAHGNTREIDR